MASKAGPKVSRAGGSGTTTSDPPQAHPTEAGAISAALLTLAEEFGRLLARRELATIRGRRAYALPELLLGASVMALIWVWVARALGWLVP